MRNVPYRYGAVTRCGPAFQPVPVRRARNAVVLQPRHGRNHVGLGCSGFARRYCRNHSCFLLLRLLRCFSSAGSPLPYGRYHIFNMVGCPIRTPADQCSCAAPRGFSQLIASFVASGSLGIPHTPFSCLSHYPPKADVPSRNPYFDYVTSKIVSLLIYYVFRLHGYQSRGV